MGADQPAADGGDAGRRGAGDARQDAAALGAAGVGAGRRREEPAQQQRRRRLSRRRRRGQLGVVRRRGAGAADRRSRGADGGVARLAAAARVSHVAARGRPPADALAVAAAAQALPRRPSAAHQQRPQPGRPTPRINTLLQRLSSGMRTLFSFRSVSSLFGVMGPMRYHEIQSESNVPLRTATQVETAAFSSIDLFAAKQLYVVSKLDGATVSRFWPEFSPLEVYLNTPLALRLERHVFACKWLQVLDIFKERLSFSSSLQTN